MKTRYETEHIFISMGLIFTIDLFGYCNGIQIHNEKNDNSLNHNSDYFINLPESRTCKQKQIPIKYANLFNNIIQIRNQCGSLCNFDYGDDFEEVPFGKTFRPINKTVKCDDLWNNSFFDQPSTIKFPIQKLPAYLLPYFNHNGRVKILSHYIDDTNTEDHETNRWGKFEFY